MSWWIRGGIVAVLGWVLLWLPPPVFAADNAATGGIGGLNNGTLLYGDGTGEARITLYSVDLALIKQARDLTGTVLPDGGTVSPGQELYFVLYVENPTDFPVSDLRLHDPLDDYAFSYLPGSLEQTLVPTGSDAAAIWAGAWAPLTDAVGPPDDGGSITDSGGPPAEDRLTVGAAPEQPNQIVDLPARSLRAIRFRVRVN